MTLDNLRVPQGATCTLNGTRLQETLKVERGATLRARTVRVNGNVQAKAPSASPFWTPRSAAAFSLSRAVQPTCAATQSPADILFNDNSGALASINNVIGDNLQAFKNTGGVTVSSNRIDGNLQCKENAPRPTGGGNIVQGNKEDQCRIL